jgi:hypothetical protein
MGSWVQDTPGQGWQGGEKYSHPNSGLAGASWNFSVPIGLYAVYMTWFPWMNRATNVSVVVRDHGELAFHTVVDQRATPSDGTYHGVGWKLLGNANCNSGRLTVALNNVANNYVIADAVGLVSLTEGVRLPQDRDGGELFDDAPEVNPLWRLLSRCRPAFRTHVIRPEDLE